MTDEIKASMKIDEIEKVCKSNNRDIYKIAIIKDIIQRWRDS